MTLLEVNSNRINQLIDSQLTEWETARRNYRALESVRVKELMLGNCPVKVQFKVLTKRADIDRHVETVRKELERETDPHCRMLQEDYLRLIQQLGSREAITRRFFLIFEHEELPGTRRGHAAEQAIIELV